ncbi:MAG: carboxypeptidase regulatory-like domain-containing protein [Pyrinomonadaceae bacterium]
MLRRVRFITLSLLLLAAAAALSATEARADTFDLTDFGAVGDGVTDDGPALQSALDALANAGGGTLIVPAGRYAIITPVFKDFSGLASSVTILGVESTTPVYTKVSGNDLANGLDLATEFYPKTNTNDAVHISGLQSFLIKDIAFVGTPDILTDAKTTLVFTDIREATVRHCEFYGLRTLIQTGAIVTAHRSILKIEQSKFLGCTGNSGVNVPLIQNHQWRGLELTNTVFLDYGERPELYGKMDRAPLAWIRMGSADTVTSDSPRRDVFIRDLFLDEGGWIGIYSQPGSPSARVDLFYITDLTMNVSNFGMFGHYLHDLRGLLIEKSRYQWSHDADAAIQLAAIDTAIFDRLECVAGADRIAASPGTQKLYVIDSTYTTLDSQAQDTQVITTTNPDEDPVQYVREQYLGVLGDAPDPVGHFYWSDLILRCANDAQCIAAKQADLNAYLATSPAPNFSLAGLVTDEDGLGVSGVAMTLSGSVSVATTTDADGHYSFNSLPTSGNYTLALSKQHYTFPQASQTFNTPAGDVAADFSAVVDRHAISGNVNLTDGSDMPSVTLTLQGPGSTTITVDQDGTFTFGELAAGENYTIVPSHPHYSFQPASITYNGLSTSQSTTFIAIINKHAIGGRVSNDSGDGLSGVTVNLSGSSAASTTTNGNGDYSFLDLDAGGNYIVDVAKAHYTFEPSGQTFSDLGENETGEFVGTLNTHTISGRVTNTDGSGFSGATVTLSGSSADTATTNSDGDYIFPDLPAGGNYTVAASKTHYTFAPATQTFNDLSGDEAGGFAGSLNTHTINGRVTKTDGTGLSGVTVTLSGSQSVTATANSDGDYSFSGLQAGEDYNLAVTKTHYTFAPSNQTFNDLGQNETAGFVGTLKSHTISGRVTTANGSGLSGVTVNLAGSQVANTTSNNNGDYSFPSLPAGGTYTLSPSKTHYTFAPASLTFADVGGDQVGNFAGTLNTHTVSGQVTETGGTGLSGVTVTLSGSQAATATTSSNGSYSFPGLPAGGNYIVAVAKTHYTFQPASQAFNDLSGNASFSFVATLQTHTISGRVTSGGNGLSEVTINLTGSQAAMTIANINGEYSFAGVPAGGSYTVAPGKTHYTFAPSSKTFSDFSGNEAAGFIATLNAHTISGHVTNTDGSGLSGVTVVLAGSQAANTTTNSNGDYSFPGLPAGGNYTIAVSKAHYTFQPSTRTFNDLGGNQAGDFVATLNGHTISGRVQRSDGSGISSVNVSLSGTLTNATTTDSSGNYLFTSCAAGGNYTVAVSRANYSFTPSSRTLNDLGASQAADFTGEVAKYQISGQVTINGAPLSGVTLTLTGPQTASSTSGDNGAYSFMATAESAYTLTPSKPNYTFNPTGLVLSNLGGNTVSNFAAQLNSGVPVLISEANSTRAIAFDAVLHTREPFPLSYTVPWVSDGRTRVMLFATNFNLAADETATAVTASAEAAGYAIYPLTVEYVGKVPGYEWLNCIVVRLWDGMGDVGDVLVSIRYRGLSSNRVRVAIGHIGGGPPDDFGAVPTPGQAPE